MALSGIWNFFMPFSMAIDPNCDYYQDMVIGQQYYIYNNEYSSNYLPSTACRWIAQSPEDTQIVLSCQEIDLPPTTNCQGDRLAISLTGDSSFTDAHNYCGKGSVSLVSGRNALVIGLFATATSNGGKFICSLTPIQIKEPLTVMTAKPISCDCGWKQATRIVGGEEAGINEFPAMAALINLNTKDVYCGASIISDRYALTAAHCFASTRNFALLVGDHNIKLGNDTAAAHLYSISKIRINENYNSANQFNDIAVVRTDKPMKFSENLGPVCLPFKYSSYDFVGEIVTALGWGALEFTGPKSDTLQKVNLTIISNQDCARNISDPLNSKQICTFGEEKDTCQYDSGGPILWYNTTTRRLQLIGLVSFGVACASARPAVSTRVTSYLAWIVSVTSDADYCIK